MKIVVSDTSPISNLFQIGEIELLPKLYGSVVIPPEVYTELMVLARFGFDLSLLESVEWLEVKACKDTDRSAELSVDLDRGEAQAIVLATEVGADLVLMDEEKGRAIARQLGLNVTGLLGVLLDAKRNQLIPLIEPLIQKLQANDFYLSEKLIELVLKQAGERS